jgi:hypothetical protein
MKNKTTLKTKISSFVKTIKAWSLATFTRDKSLNNFTKAGVVIGLATTPIVFVACLPTEKPNDQEQNPSGDQIQSGNQNPSGDINKDPEKPTDPVKPVDPEKPTEPEKPTNPTDPEKPAIPGDENYDYPTTMAELEASPDKIKLQQLLTNYIDENLKEMIAGIGFNFSTLKNTKTIAYDIDVENNKITGFFNTVREEKNHQYYITESYMKEDTKINLVEILKYQAQIDNDELDVTAPKPAIQINIPKTKNLFSIAITKNQNEFQPYAKDVLESLTGEKHENAEYFAENMGSAPAFGSGNHPIVRTTKLYREGNKFTINYITIIAKDYSSIGTENEKEYIENKKEKITFGTENTFYIEDIKEKEDEIIMVSVDNKEYAIIKDNQTYFIEQ